MNDTPKLVITPDKFMGWTLRHEFSHDGSGDYRAECERWRLHARTLSELLDMIRASEKTVRRLTKPLRILHIDDSYGGSHEYTPATVTMVENERIYIERVNGEVVHTTTEALAENCNSGSRSSLKYILDSKDNLAKIAKSKRLKERGADMCDQATALLKTLTPLTGVDVRESL